MLQYRRRNSNTPLQHETNITRHPLLTYCNWSHDSSRHIDTQRLRNILTRFQDNYIHFYLRIINDTPRNVVNSFIVQEHLHPNTLENIYQILNNRGFDLKNL